MRVVYRGKIGIRLGCGFGIVVLLMIFMGTIAVVQLNDAADMTAQLYNHPLAVSNAVRDIRAEIVAMHRSMKDVVLARSAEQLDAAKESLSEHEQNTLDSFKIIFERFLGDKSDVEAAHKAFIDWRPIRQEVIELMHLGRTEEASAITKGRGADHVDNMNEKIQKMSNYASKKAETFFKKAQDSGRHHIWIMSGSILLIIIACTFMGIFITGSINSS